MTNHKQGLLSDREFLTDDIISPEDLSADILIYILDRKTFYFWLKPFKVVKIRYNENHYRVEEPVKRIWVLCIS